MIIVTFHIADDHTVTLEMGQLPPQATRHNTTIDIGGVAQSDPQVVSFKEQRVVFNAGAGDQHGPITVTVSGRAPVTATSAEPYATLHPDSEIGEKAVIRSVYPTPAKAGDAVTIRGLNFKYLAELYVGQVKVPNATRTETSARFTIPAQVRAGTYPIRFKDSKFSGSVENSTVRLEVTAPGGD